MDLDAYVATHQATWAELDRLSRQQKLTSEESDRLVRLYQQTTTHLSTLRSQAPDATLVMSLSSIVSRSRRRLGASSESLVYSVKHFFSTVFPVELYRLRWWWLSLMILSYAVAAAVALWVYFNPELHHLLGSPTQIKKLVNHDFEAYYSEYAHSHFAASVWVNNAWVSAQAVAMGFTGIWVIILLYQNILNLGLNAGLMIYYGKAGLFWGLILPHGLLELTAVFVACAAGLNLFWSWVHPGPLTMSESFAQTGRRVMTIVLGLIVVLAVAGFIEGFVTPSDLPTFARVGIGIIALVLFLMYALVLGRKRYLEGSSSDVADWQRADELRAVE